MPRKSRKVPSYCLHKASGRAVVRINGHDSYLGAYGSPESYEAYERRIAEWRVQLAEAAVHSTAPDKPFQQLTVNELILRYIEFAKGYYIQDGRATKEFAEMKYALGPLRKLFGRSPVCDIGPLALKSIQRYMIEAENLSRGVINHRVNRIKRVFKWAVSEELAPPGAYEALRSVQGLRFGRTTARETEPVKPVPRVWVDAVLPYVSPQIAAMIQVQELAAMRPCEVVIMRACDIDMSGDVWIYEPYDHKNRWRDHRRLIALGPKTQEIIKPFVSLKTDAFLFSPIDAEAWRNEQRRQKRKTSMTPSHRKRKPNPNPKRAKRDHYDVDSYRRAISYAITKANRERPEDNQIPFWTPLQLRHSRATDVRKEHGLEAAQCVLGHARADVTQVYAERNLDYAIRVARETG